MNNFKKTNHKSGVNNRINFLLAVIFLSNFLIIVKLFSLQIINGSLFAEASDNQQNIYQQLIPERGKIYLEDAKDGKLYPVATNQQLALVYAEPKIIKNYQELAKNLAEILKPLWLQELNLLRDIKEKSKGDDRGEPIKEENFFESKENELKEKLSKAKDPYEILAKKVPAEILDKIKELGEPGIGYDLNYYRYYPEAEMLSGVSGFVGYYGDDVRGQYGIEGYFDELLRGKPGSLSSKKDALGYIIMTKNSEIVPAEDGIDVVLTIDRALQFKVCAELEAAVKSHEADKGMAVVMDPNTGEIIAMCNVPTYDSNLYYAEDDLSLFNNPIISDQFEPGSIFKAVTIAAGIDAGKISPDTTYYDAGCVKVGVETICNSDLKSHETQSMTNVLEESLNTGTIFVLNQLGREKFREYLYNFGFGSETGIELDPEAVGNIRSLDLTRDIYSATASFGQGISVTPIQMINAFSVIANGGKLMKPYIVKKTIFNDGTVNETKPKEIRRVISQKTSLLLGGMLASVVKKGHGTRAGVAGYYIAGKTGTAQVSKEEGGGYDDEKTIGSFAGFGPVENPKFAMLVRIDNPKDVIWAESSAAPLFGKIAKILLDYYEIKPSY